MQAFLQEARYRITQLAPGAQPELEIRIPLDGKRNFLAHLAAIKSQKPYFVQRCDIHYELGGLSRQCRVFFRGTKKERAEFMMKRTEYHVDEKDVGRRLVLASETPLAAEELPPTIAQCFLKLRCMLDFTHWRVEFIASHQIKVLTLEQIVASRRNYFAQPIETLDAYIAFVSNPIYVFDAFSVEYELQPESVKLLSDTSIAAIFDEFATIDQLIFKLDAEAIQFRTLLREAYALFARGANDNFRTIKQATNQARTLTSQLFVSKFPFSGWYVTEKSDGTHALLYAAANGGVYLLGATLITLRAPGDGEKAALAPIVLDGEYVIRGEEADPCFIPFDVIIHDGIQVYTQPFHERLGFMEAALKRVSERLGASPPLSLFTKTFARLGDPRLTAAAAQKYADQIGGVWQEAQAHAQRYGVDGLVYISPSEPYWTTAIYKWKPAARTTIDFLAKRVPDNLSSTPPFRNVAGMDQYVLYCTIDAAQRLVMQEPPYIAAHFTSRPSSGRSPIPFHTSLGLNMHIFHYPKSDASSLDGQVIELAPTWYDLRGAAVLDEAQIAAQRSLLRLGWRFERVREDRQADVLSGKYFGNFWAHAEQNLLTFIFPLTLGNLQGDMKVYFQNTKTTQYQAMADFNNRVKRVLFKTYIAETATLLDLAAGRGSDIHNYVNNVTQRVFIVERDEAAIQTLIFRKHEVYVAGDRNSKPKRPYPQLLIMAGDLLKPAVETISRLENMGAPQLAKGKLSFDNATCFFALHYLTVGAEARANIARLVANTVKPGGHFIFTMFNARRVTQLLDSHSGVWSVEENGRAKYHIELVTTPEIQPKIKLMLPFTQGQLVSEYLVDADVIVAEFERAGMTLVDRFDFDAKFRVMEDGFNTLAAALSEGDRQFVGLNLACVLAKK